MKASTEDGKREYESWEDLVEAEANGYVVVAILRERAPKQTLFPMVIGPFPTKLEAEKVRNRTRTKYRRQDREGTVHSDIVSLHVKPSWKDLS